MLRGMSAPVVVAMGIIPGQTRIGLWQWVFKTLLVMVSLANAIISLAIYLILISGTFGTVGSTDVGLNLALGARHPHHHRHRRRVGVVADRPGRQTTRAPPRREDGQHQKAATPTGNASETPAAGGLNKWEYRANALTRRARQLRRIGWTGRLMGRWLRAVRTAAAVTPSDDRKPSDVIVDVAMVVGIKPVLIAVGFALVVLIIVALLSATAVVVAAFGEVPDGTLGAIEEIPPIAAEAYMDAVAAGEEELGCLIHPAVVAAIGWVESRHGSDRLDAYGDANPPIIGVPLDGTDGVALIWDTDDGVYDRDVVYDRAVGPMQFIPGTWEAWGQDANGDGIRNPQNIFDAAKVHRLVPLPRGTRRPDRPRRPRRRDLALQPLRGVPGRRARQGPGIHDADVRRRRRRLRPHRPPQLRRIRRRHR